MGVLVCDICGGKLTMQAGGIAVCNVCGMEYSKEALQEKYLSSGGRSIVQIDNSNMIDRWMVMGADAARTGNWKEAYDYYTKVVENDPLNWKAILEKGKTAFCQSTADHNRAPELELAVTRTLSIVDSMKLTEEEESIIRNDCAVSLYRANNAITEEMKSALMQVDELTLNKDLERVLELRERFITNIKKNEYAISLISGFSDSASKRNILMIKERICEDLVNACGFWSLFESYYFSTKEYRAVGFSKAEKEEYIKKFWKLVDEIRITEPSFATAKYSLIDPFDPPRTGQDAYRAERVFDYWNEIEKRKETAEKS